MGELNLDNIDRALMQEYQRCHDGYRFKEAVKAIENLGQKVPSQILRGGANGSKNQTGCLQSSGKCGR